MTVMDLLRSAREAVTSDGDRDSEPEAALGLVLAARRGAGAAVASALLVALPVLVAWLASAQSTISWTSALAMGSSLWLLCLGAHVDPGGGVTVALAPLLATAGFVALAVRSAIRVGQTAPERGPRWAGLPREGATMLAAWSAGYAVVAAVLAGLAFAGPARPSPGSLVLPVVVVPVASALVAVVWLVLRWDYGRLELPWSVPAGPVLARAWRPALFGVGTTLALSFVVVVVQVVVHGGAVAQVHEGLGAGLVGGVVITLAQVMVLPNLGLWAVSFAAGPGFQVIDGSATTWTGSRGDLLPMLPVLGAMPAPGALPGWLPVTVLLPVLVGALVGWRALRGMARLTGLLTKACVCATAVVLAALGLGLLNLLAGGSLGTDQLAHVGAPTLELTGALLVEFGVGALVVFLADLWRVRR